MKFGQGPARNVFVQSLPTRERGLKFKGCPGCGRRYWSLPTRERGLKCCGPYQCDRCLRVAPHAGAWIEISLSIAQSWTLVRVAPHAGAWIEIDIVLVSGKARPLSLPTRERGLKWATTHRSLILLLCRSPRGSVD